MHQLAMSLGLIAVIEGLVVFAAPRQWQAAMREAQRLSPKALRVIGAIAIILGLVTLHLMR